MTAATFRAKVSASALLLPEDQMEPSTDKLAGRAGATAMVATTTTGWGKENPASARRDANTLMPRKKRCRVASSASSAFAGRLDESEKRVGTSKQTMGTLFSEVVGHAQGNGGKSCLSTGATLAKMSSSSRHFIFTTDNTMSKCLGDDVNSMTAMGTGTMTTSSRIERGTESNLAWSNLTSALADKLNRTG